MIDVFCARCGAFLPDGSVRYVVRIQIVSDFDDDTSPLEEKPYEEVQNLLKNMGSANVDEVEDIFCQEFTVYLCGRCRDRFARDPFKDASSATRKHLGNVLH